MEKGKDRQELFKDIISHSRDKERRGCNPGYATVSSESLGRLRREKGRRDAHRPVYALDRDRILYSKGFFRLAGKTQVFLSPQNPTISNRMTHTLHVAQISRTIARLLDLNEDLAEAIALGHDLGHPPFGHRGEHILNELSMRHMGAPFKHNLHSLRIVDVLEKGGRGLNLSYEVREGIARHCGETEEHDFAPGKASGDMSNPGGDGNPCTLEGCVVKICDRIGYVGKDIEDAAGSGIIRESDIPEEISRVLGKTNGQIIDTLVMDVVINFFEDRERFTAKSFRPPPRDRISIRLGAGIAGALNRLINEFNYPRIYESRANKRYAGQTEKMLTGLFAIFMEEMEEMRLPDESQMSLGDFSKRGNAAMASGDGLGSLGEMERARGASKGEKKGRDPAKDIDYGKRRALVIKENLRQMSKGRRIPRNSVLHFLDQMGDDYWAATGNAQVVIDYISFMTDEMAMAVYESLTIPKPVV